MRLQDSQDQKVRTDKVDDSYHESTCQQREDDFSAKARPTFGLISSQSLAGVSTRLNSVGQKYVMETRGKRTSTGEGKGASGQWCVRPARGVILGR